MLFFIALRVGVCGWLTEYYAPVLLVWRYLARWVPVWESGWIASCWSSTASVQCGGLTERGEPIRPLDAARCAGGECFDLHQSDYCSARRGNNRHAR